MFPCHSTPPAARSRARVTLACLLALIGLMALLPSHAAAKACTLGVDMPQVQDRDPSTCAHFPLVGNTTGPIASGPGNSVTFTARDGGGLAILRMDPDGRMSRFGLPGWAQSINGLATGPDGSHWFTAGAAVGRIDESGNVSPVPVPALDATGGIVSGPDGALWYAGKTFGVGRVPTSGQPNFFFTGATAGGITAGSDGALWYTAYNAIGRITTGGQVSKFPLPGGLTADGEIITARDGVMWFADKRDGKVGRITTGGDISAVDLGYRPLALAPGPGSNTIWMTLLRMDGRETWVARMNTRSFPAGRQPGVSCDPKAGWSCKFDFKYAPLGELTRLNTLGYPGEVTLGNDGRIYYAEGNKIGRVLPYRGAQLCGRAPSTSDLVGGSAYCPRTPSVTATNSYTAYIHTTCPKFSLRYCAGTMDAKLNGALLGRASFVVHTFDSPSARVVLNQRGKSLLKRRGSLRLQTTIYSRDAGGLSATRGGPIVIRRP
ncbi:MAG: virginiamycin lyase [Solirubrobacteraceae bacterium]|nr:virginiamycin lyase [Solirubrobacteraceae bacterium]